MPTACGPVGNGPGASQQEPPNVSYRLSATAVVFERGLRAVPLSVDLWLHYLGYVRSVHEQRPDLVRDAFERAVAACGLEFRSDRLWEQYASWETQNKEGPRALAVYRRALAVPTLSYRTHFENLEQFVGETPPQDLLTVEEFLEARRAVLAELKASEPAPAQPSSELLPPGCDEAPPGLPAPPVILSSDDEGVRLRSRILAPLRQLHMGTEKQVSLRWNYEELIKRPYFHVKPLEKGQLKNWKAYLDFEIEQGDKERIRVLFERCLIACALYEEYWLKYIRYLESQDPVDPDLIRSVYERACWTHLPKKPTIHMLWATFEEKQGDLERASEVVERLSALVAALEVTQRRINLARRRGRLELAERLYADTLKTCLHKGQAVAMAVKFVRFLYKVRDDRPKAEEVLREAIRHDPVNQRLYLQLVDLGFQSRPVDVAMVQDAFRMALASGLELRDRLLFAHRRVEFLEEFGEDIQSLQAAQEEYSSLARAAKAEAKRRKQEEADDTEPGRPAASGGPVSAAGTKRPAAAAATAQNGTEKRARADGAAAAPAPTVQQTAVRPTKPAYQAPQPTPTAAAPFAQPPPPPQQQQQQPFGGYGHPQQQQQYFGGYQYPGPGGWNYPGGQHNYNQYGQYPYH
ncbi:pre-mRNA-processing factor 39-like isoform X2 [Pollicipes pollicipes]|uniref:pre-mRNA-processing factor 39-like isoform X2 n=1 Tax=Pollicipes pollicipes TaxID=41117 RepID=UPI0018850857|nr:pre-mRNA-processing factor 39-like isoform X2 [Pollicipes pollicipes]